VGATFLSIIEYNFSVFSRLQNAGQHHDIKIANKSLENVAQFRYLNDHNKSKPDSGGN
jgi:hypothetical protein